MKGLLFEIYTKFCHFSENKEKNSITKKIKGLLIVLESEQIMTVEQCCEQLGFSFQHTLTLIKVLEKRGVVSFVQSDSLFWSKNGQASISRKTIKKNNDITCVIG